MQGCWKALPVRHSAAQAMVCCGYMLGKMQAVTLLGGLLSLASQQRVGISCGSPLVAAVHGYGLQPVSDSLHDAGCRLSV
jgi:hypothetical protein